MKPVIPVGIFEIEIVLKQ